jgi:hypothetical protein
MESLHMNQLPRYYKSVISYESSARGSNPFLTVGSEGQLCGTGVAAIEGPFGLAMTYNKDPWSCHCCLSFGFSGVVYVRS